MAGGSAIQKGSSSLNLVLDDKKFICTTDTIRIKDKLEEVIETAWKVILY